MTKEVALRYSLMRPFDGKMDILAYKSYCHTNHTVKDYKALRSNYALRSWHFHVRHARIIHSYWRRLEATGIRLQKQVIAIYAQAIGERVYMLICCKCAGIDKLKRARLQHHEPF
jgi:hypothetical protein